jgi:tetratricopeptide (TPR) repeat protein
MFSDAFWVACVVIVLIIAVSASITIARAGRHQGRRRREAYEAKDRPSQPPRKLAWTWMLLLIAVGLGVWARQPRGRARNPVRASDSFMASLVAGGVSAAFVALIFACHFIRNYDGALQRAQKLADDGDVDGAIADLRELIEIKGPTQNRVNALAILLLNHNRFNEAAAFFRKAEELGELKGVCRLNLGVALLKGGKPGEAIPVIEEAVRVGPQIPVMKCIANLHMTHALADLDRWEEARSHFEIALTTASTLRKSQRDSLAIEIARLRERLDARLSAIAKPDATDATTFER